MPDDGASFLTSGDVQPLLESAVEYGGGLLLDWELEHVDQTPNQSTTATYRAEVRWPHGVRTELFGVSARAGEMTETDSNAHIFFDGSRRVAVWLYPKDPDLPGLQRAAFADGMVEVLNSGGIFPTPLTAEEITLEMIGYRPRRRAVVQVDARGRRFYVKVLRPHLADDIIGKHRMLAESHFPGPRVLMSTEDHLLVTEKLPGIPLAKALFEPGEPCTAEDIIATLDSMPQQVATLDRRQPWAASVGYYGRMVRLSAPELEADVDWLVETIERGLARIPQGDEPTHGDFHEGQVHVGGGRLVGVLDVDTIGPGRRADDIACLIGHLATIQRMNPAQEARVREILALWVPVFDQRVDPVELRLRAAAVILSLATGPYRTQEHDWREQTHAMVQSALALVKQVV